MTISTHSAAAAEGGLEGAVESVAAVPGVIEQVSGIGGAFTISIIAFSVVFLVLGGLSGVIFGIKYIAAAFDKKGAPPASGGGGGAPAAAPSAPAPAAQANGDGRLMAVLAAAVAVSGGSGRIVGVERASASRARPAAVPGWKSAGVADNTTPFGRNWR